MRVTAYLQMSVHAFDSSQVVGEAGTDAGQHVARFEHMFVCSMELGIPACVLT